MHTPFGFFTRRCVQDYTIPNSNVKIEKGTQVMISVDGIHYDPKYFEQPMQFMPERFSGEKVTFAERPFLSFGDGPRFELRGVFIQPYFILTFFLILPFFISFRNCIGLRFAKLQTKLGIVLLLRKFKFDLSNDHINKELEMAPRGLAKLPTKGINLKVSFRDGTL